MSNPNEEEKSPNSDRIALGSTLIAQYPEFALWAEPDGLPKIVLGNQVQQALDKFEYRINDAGSDQSKLQRVNRARAMELFLYFAAYPSSPLSPERVAHALKEAFREEVSRCFERRPERETNYEWLDVDNVRLDELANAFKSAVLAAGSKIRGKKSKNADGYWKKEVITIRIAERLFLESLVRPKKSSIKAVMEWIGLGFKGANASAQWRELFEKTGLAGLPD